MLLSSDAAVQLIALQLLSELSICRIQPLGATDGRESGCCGDSLYCCAPVGRQMASMARFGEKN